MEATSINSLLNENLDGLSKLSAELILIFGSIVLLISGIFGLQRMLQVGLYGLIIAVAIFFKSTSIGPLFNGDLVVTELGSNVQYLLLFASLSMMLFRSFWKRNTEFYFMLLAMLTGCMLMVCARNLLLIFLSIELASMPAYIATAFHFRKKSFEAAIKYLLTGIICSAIMLYGMSLIYGLEGTLLPAGQVSDELLSLVGWSMLLVGILFKVSVFPAHLWVPATYQVAPTELVAFFTIVPKIAGFALLLSLAPVLQREWIINILFLAAIASILIGTFSALQQTQVKRMLAYGAIAHSGFLLPLTMLPDYGSQAFLYYIWVYALMNIGAFYFVSCFEEKGELELARLSGLGQMSPIIGGGVVVIMISLVGLPPTAGFSIKLWLFSAVWQAYEASGNYLYLTFVVLGILSSAVSLFFYLRVPYYCFMVPSESKELRSSNWKMATFMLFFALSLILVFAVPDIFDNFILLN
ncbi:MAG: NADH-quinone oxidoreductase subunit N [Cytophagales bacterium]|nr:NADH-quinone oxidoreductase subunit N [Cytophagales bacterium]